MRKRIPAIIIVVALVALLGWQIYRRAAAPSEAIGDHGQSRTVPVEIARVEVSTIRDVGSFTGTLLAHSQFVIAPKIAGRLERLHVNIGDEVKRDQLIAELDAEEYVQQVEQSRAELDVTKASVAERQSALEVATREFERAQSLRQQQIASESELDEAQANFKAAEANYSVALAQVEQKEAALKGAEVRLSYTSIKASWEGGDNTRVVGERFADEGAMLRANDPIVSILEIDSLTALLYVSERDYSKIQIGQETTVSADAFPSTDFSGRVVRVAPVLKETSRQARVEVEIPNPEHLLKPGMFVRTRIEFAEHTGVRLVPLSALTRREGRQGVFLADLEQMTAHFVSVSTGIVDVERAEVLEPALDGYVVVLGQHLLEDGGAITLPSGPPEGQPLQPSPDATGAPGGVE